MVDFQHLKLHAHVSVVLSPSSQCENIGFGGGGGASIYMCACILSLIVFKGLPRSSTTSDVEGAIITESSA